MLLKFKPANPPALFLLVLSAKLDNKEDVAVAFGAEEPAVLVEALAILKLSLLLLKLNFFFFISIAVPGVVVLESPGSCGVWKREREFKLEPELPEAADDNDDKETDLTIPCDPLRLFDFEAKELVELLLVLVLELAPTSVLLFRLSAIKLPALLEPLFLKVPFDERREEVEAEVADVAVAVVPTRLGN